jgi:hypothetical protein
MRIISRSTKHYDVIGYDGILIARFNNIKEAIEFIADNNR